MAPPRAATTRPPRSLASIRYFTALTFSAGFACGCGSQADADIPPELLEALSERGESEAYPDGPTGGELGDVAANVCFPAWDNPEQENYDPDALVSRCLADYWDPAGEQHQLLFVVSAAIWCQSCQAEFGGVGEAEALGVELTQRHEAGLRALGGLFQNAQGDPASTDDGVRWARTFGVNFPFGVDADFTLGRFAKADAQPLHMLIDTATMEIVYKATGGSIALLWEQVDVLLGTTDDK